MALRAGNIIGLIFKVTDPTIFLDVVRRNMSSIDKRGDQAFATVVLRIPNQTIILLLLFIAILAFN